MRELDWVNYKYHNDRDLEEIIVRDFVARAQNSFNVTTIFDIGCHWSGHTYAPFVRDMIGNGVFYHGVDILDPDEETPKYLKYVQGNVLDPSLITTNYEIGGGQDLVLCISSIEHAGITTYQKTDYKSEQHKVFNKCLDLTKKRFLLTHPYGLEALYEGQYANITPAMLSIWQQLSRDKGFSYQTNYYWNPFCQGGGKWHEVDKEFADKQPMDKSKGTQCVAVTEFHK
jgi:hypothetical protein